MYCLDLRSKDIDLKRAAHKPGKVTCIEFHPRESNLMMTAGNDHFCKLFDIRQLRPSISTSRCDLPPAHHEPRGVALRAAPHDTAAPPPFRATVTSRSPCMRASCNVPAEQPALHPGAVSLCRSLRADSVPEVCMSYMHRWQYARLAARAVRRQGGPGGRRVQAGDVREPGGP